MGLFTKIKNIFSKNIECGDEVENHFIYFYPLKNRIVNIGSNIVVRPGYNAVFVYGDKVCDVLPSGKHKIGNTTLPITFDRLKLNKPNKYDNLPKKFKADIYFVNTNLNKEVDFNSDIPFVAKSETFGKVKGYCEGVFDMQVVQPEKVMKFMLADCAYLKNKQGIKKLKLLVGNEVNRGLEKSHLHFSEVLMQPQTLYDYFNPAMNDKILFTGISVNNVEVTSLRLNRKMQEKVAEYLESQKSNNAQKLNAEKLKEELAPEKVYVRDDTDAFGGAANYSSQSYGNANVASNSYSAQSVGSYNAEQNVTPTPINNSVGADINPKSNVEFNPFAMRRGGVANVPQNPNPNLNVNNAKINAGENLMNGENLKQCKYCGATIDVSCSFCPKCGFKQN